MKRGSQKDDTRESSGPLLELWMPPTKVDYRNATADAIRSQGEPKYKPNIQTTVDGLGAGVPDDSHTTTTSAVVADRQQYI